MAGPFLRSRRRESARFSAFFLEVSVNSHPRLRISRRGKVVGNRNAARTQRRRGHSVAKPQPKRTSQANRRRDGTSLFPLCALRASAVAKALARPPRHEERRGERHQRFQRSLRNTWTIAVQRGETASKGARPVPGRSGWTAENASESPDVSLLAKRCGRGPPALRPRRTAEERQAKHRKACGRPLHPARRLGGLGQHGFRALYARCPHRVGDVISTGSESWAWKLLSKPEPWPRVALTFR